MIIGIDARVLLEGKGGIFVYAKNLLQELVPRARAHQVKLFVNRYHRAGVAQLAPLLKYPHVKLCQYRFPNKLLNTAFRAWQWPQIDRLLDGCDVLFFPTMLYGAWSPSIKTVLTMHDLSFAWWPEFFTARQRLWHKLMRPAALTRKVTRVIAVSENTRQDIMRLYNLPSWHVRTIHSGLDPIFRPIVDRSELEKLRQKYHLPPQKFILQVGTIEPRKNPLATLTSFAAWQKQHPAPARDYHLIFAGHAGWKQSAFEQALSSSSVRSRVHLLIDPPLEDLSGLYNLASIFIYPSFYEGFGFPPLEAMACGVPVIASATSSLGEIVGPAGLLIDPYRIDDIVEAMQALTSDHNLAKTLRARGIARTVEFSWEKTARETLKVLENV